MPSTWIAVGLNVAESQQAQVSLRAGVWTRDFMRNTSRAVDFELRLFGFAVGFELSRPRRYLDVPWVWTARAWVEHPARMKGQWVNQRRSVERQMRQATLPVSAPPR